MRVLVDSLKTFVPAINGWPADKIASRLTDLGFEAEQESASVLTVSLTPNRADGYSAIGLARDLAAWLANADRSAPPPLTLADRTRYDRLPELTVPTVTNHAPALILGYFGIVLEGVRVGPSPAWLRKAVISLGWRSINSIVDLTNYLMEQFGQPLHAFDLDAILGGELTLRTAHDGEHVVTLDGVDRTLPAGALVIQDRESLIDLAGIMGGQSAEIHPNTTRVLVQAAQFDSASIRATTQAVGLTTQAAVRYERGVDPAIAPAVLSEVVRIVRRRAFGPARVIGRVQSTTTTVRSAAIRYRPLQANHLLGFSIPPRVHRRSLEQLGFTVNERRDGWLVRSPSWRFDCTRWQDLAEEVVRLFGLNERVPAPPLPHLELAGRRTSQLEWSEGLKDRLIELGLTEVLTYSFVSRPLLDLFGLPIVGELENPLNPARRYLRPSLVPNLAEVVAANAPFNPIQIFEVGRVFTASREELRLGVALAGQVPPSTAWLARFADRIGLDSAVVKAAAVVTEFTEPLLSALKIRKRTGSLIEFRIDDLQSARRIPARPAVPSDAVQYRTLSRYPVGVRDLALIVGDRVTVGEIETFAHSLSERIEGLQCFDEFRAERFGPQRKSLAFHVRYADPHRTMTDNEIEVEHERLVSALVESFQATRR